MRDGVGMRAVPRLRRVHWSKEASSLGCAFIYWSPYWSQWIIDATVEAIIRRWGCHVGGNDFISRWQVVITIRQHCSLHWLTVLSSTTQMSIPITEIAVYVMS